MKKLALLLLAGLAACDVGERTAPIVDPDEPTNLTFQLLPSGDPNVPLGVLLSWDPPSNNRAVVFDVYGRSNGTGSGTGTPSRSAARTAQDGCAARRRRR